MMASSFLDQKFQVCSCAGWFVSDLVGHTEDRYRNNDHCMRLTLNKQQTVNYGMIQLFTHKGTQSEMKYVYISLN